MNYISGRNNLACTIFVPFKCGNNCPFCTSKQMYENYTFDISYLEKIINWITTINKNKYVSEFVITGGEPFFNLSVLKILINHMEKNVFINTTFPKLKNTDEIIDYINTENKIKGINISRHINVNYNVKISDKETLDKIKKTVRINCILKDEFTEQQVFDFINYWCSDFRMVNFRADYRNINTDTLKNRDKWTNFFLNNFTWEYTNNCLVCNSEVYTDDVSKVISYHRGLEQSSVTCGERCYVNDIIIDIYGNIFKDWDLKEDKEFINKFIN